MAEEKDRKIIDEARERYRVALDAWAPNFKRFDEGMRFHIGQQFSEQDYAARGEDRPLLPFNVVRSKINQIVNSFRNNRPGPRVTPTDSTTLDSAGAEIHEGLLRATDYSSNSETAYDTAFKFAAAGGFSYFGLSFDYASPDSFDMTTQVRYFPDPKSVLIDPAAQDPNGIDMTYAFVRSKMPIAAYERKYGKSELAKNGFACSGPDAIDWVNEYEVQVVEYWTIEYKPRVLVDIDDGNAMFADDPRFEHFLQSQTDLHALADPETGELDITAVFRTREVEYPYVKQRLMNAVEILEEKEFPSTCIPIFLVTANDDIVEGKRVISGLLADAIAPQQSLSYVETLSVEAFSLMPKPRFVCAAGAIEGFEDDWSTANRSNKSVFQYNPVTLNGQLANRPEWVVFDPKTQALDIAANRYRDIIREVIGVYSSQVGSPADGVHSGTAIRALQSAGANATSHIVSNFNRALAHRYRTETEMNNRLMSVGQQVRVLGADEKAKIQMVNESFFSTRLDVTVNTGPSFASEQEFQQQTILGLAQADPAGFSQIRDLAVRYMRLGNIGDQIAKRWTPPQYAEDSPLPPQVQQQMGQLQQLAHAQSEKINQLTAVIQQKQVEAQTEAQLETMKFEHQRELALIAQQTQLLSVDARTDTQRALGELEAQLEALRLQLQQAHEERMSDKKHSHQFALESAHHAVEEVNRHADWDRNDAKEQQQASQIIEVQPADDEQDLAA